MKFKNETQTVVHIVFDDGTDEVTIRCSDYWGNDLDVELAKSIRDALESGAFSVQLTRPVETVEVIT